jgi:hypothetical protein
MSKEDVLLIAGKGHETYQLLGPRIIAFDDVEIAQNWPGFQKGVKKTALTAVSG